MPRNGARGPALHCALRLHFQISLAVQFLRRLAEGALALASVIGEAAGLLHHPHGDQAALGVDRHVGRISATVAEAVLALDRPAQAVALLDASAGLLARHLLDSGFREYPLAFMDAAVEHHLAE